MATAIYQVETDQGVFDVEVEDQKNVEPKTLAGKAVSLLKEAPRPPIISRDLPKTSPFELQPLSSLTKAGERQREILETVGAPELLTKYAPMTPEEWSNMIGLIDIPLAIPALAKMSLQGIKYLGKKSYKGVKSLGKGTLNVADKVAGKTIESVGEIIESPSAIELPKFQSKTIEELEKVALPKLEGKFAPSEKGLETIRKAEKMGIELPIGARTESPGLISTEASLYRRAGGEPVFLKRKEAEKSLETFAKEYSLKFGKDLSSSEINKKIIENFDNILKDKNKLSQQYYDDLGKVAGDVLVDGKQSSTSKFIRLIFKERGFNITEEGQVISKLETAKKLKTEFEMLNSILRDIENKNLSYNDLNNIKKIVGELSDFESVRASGFSAIYKKIYGHIVSDLTSTAEKGGYKEIAQNANKFYREFMEFIDSAPSQQILRAKDKNPDKLIDELIKPKSSTNINLIMKEFSEDGKNYLRKGFMDKIFDIAKDPQSPDQNILPEKLATELNKYDEETLSSLFGNYANVIIDIREVANAMARGAGLRGGSPTSILDDMKELIRLNPMPAISRLIARQKVSEILTKRETMRTLTERPTIGKPRLIE